MNNEQKAAVIDEIAEQIRTSDAIFAVDYRGLSVPDAAELRGRLTRGGRHVPVVKNRLTIRAADKAGAEALKELLEGPTALTFVRGATPRPGRKGTGTVPPRRPTCSTFKGGRMNGESLSIDEIKSIPAFRHATSSRVSSSACLPSPITTLVRGLASLISGLAQPARRRSRSRASSPARPRRAAPRRHPLRRRRPRSRRQRRGAGGGAR